MNRPPTAPTFRFVELLLALSVASCASSGTADTALDAGEEIDVGRALDLGRATDLGAAPARDAAMPEASVGVDAPSADSGRTCLAHGAEETDALCANGVDDDCDGYVDCRDFDCSRSAAVSVCGSADAGTTAAMDAPAAMDVPLAPGIVGAHGGTVDRLNFAVFGDVRPPNYDDTANYPSAVFGSVVDGMASLSPQFVVGTGDYMFASASSTTVVSAQLDLLLAVEARFTGHFFHAMGNHECTGASASNCPLGNETANARGFHARLASAYATPYYDFVVHTSLGDAHFIVTAPNAWSAAQDAWLTAALAQSARYTIVVAHEPPDAREAPGTAPAEALVAARPGGVTLHLYGHYHEFSHRSPNLFISGNAGAPLASATGSYGFLLVTQRADGNLVLTAYDVGRPPMVAATFVLTPAGEIAR